MQHSFFKGPTYGSPAVYQAHALCRNVITSIAIGTYNTGVQFPLSGAGAAPAPSLLAPAPAPACELLHKHTLILLWQIELEAICTAISY